MGRQRARLHDPPDRTMQSAPWHVGLEAHSRLRTKVDTILQQHPDFDLLSEGIPSDDPNFGLRVFMRAATYPDLIKSDPRY